MDPRVHDQQPIARTVGRRVAPPIGEPPDREARAACDSMLAYRTRAPKGVFLYRSFEEMNRDRERWIVEAIVARQRQRV